MFCKLWNESSLGNKHITMLQWHTFSTIEILYCDQIASDHYSCLNSATNFFFLKSDRPASSVFYIWIQYQFSSYRLLKVKRNITVPLIDQYGQNIFMQIFTLFTCYNHPSNPIPNESCLETLKSSPVVLDFMLISQFINKIRLFICFILSSLLFKKFYVMELQPTQLVQYYPVTNCCDLGHRETQLEVCKRFWGEMWISIPFSTCLAG